MSDLNLAIEYCLIQSNILMSHSSSILMHYYICMLHLSLFLKRIMQLLGGITIAYSKVLSLVHIEVELI
jgi:hypothetical protein